MKRYFILLFTVFAAFTATAQSKGVKIAYIDMDYILDKVPDFAEAKSQLEQRAAKWKQEMDVKRNDITKLKESLQAEKALLTKELIEDREEEIAVLEKDLIDYQEKKFGPKGDLITQKTVLVKPIQDQVFTIVQDLAAARKYDFVFDKSSDLTMLFAANKHNISDLIVKRLTRSAKQEKMTSKEAKKMEEQEKLDEENSDPDKIDKQKALDDKKAARQKAIDDRKAAADAKRQAALDRRDQILKEREDAKNAKKAGTTTTATAKDSGKTTGTTTAKDSNKGTGTTTTPVGGDDDAPADTSKKAAPATDSKDADKDGDASTPAKTTASDLKAQRDAAAQGAKEEHDRKVAERAAAIQKRKEEAQAKRDAARKAKEDKLKENSTPAEPAGDDPAPTTTPTPENNTGGND